MSIKVMTTLAPACWASYLINGDASGLDAVEKEACDKWIALFDPWYVVAIEDGAEPQFTNAYSIYGGTASAGDVIKYVQHKRG